MSWDAAEWCRERGDIRGATKNVLYQLCLRLNDEDGACFPSYTTLGREAGYSRRTAISVVAKLVQAGELRRHYRGGRTSNRYDILSWGSCP
jgi:hypothetical protein